MTADHNLRDGMIYQAQQERISRDVKIMQKVGAANREAFVQRFPGQLEHSMRWCPALWLAWLHPLRV